MSKTGGLFMDELAKRDAVIAELTKALEYYAESDVHCMEGGAGCGVACDALDKAQELSSRDTVV
jgi:hypothetical protein